MSPKRAASEAMTRSQCSTISRPPVTAGPFTAAMTGLAGRCQGALSPAEGPAERMLSPVSPSSRRSSPAQKACPAPVSTTARTRASSVSRAMVALSSRISREVSALRRSGRLSVTVATAPSCSTRTQSEGFMEDTPDS
ncbi:hypothetical protein SHIRM173S_01426 [Streptomyces hirsutus]